MIPKEAKAKAAEPFKMHGNDTGSTAVQVAVLTARINDLTKHISTNKYRRRALKRFELNFLAHHHHG